MSGSSAIARAIAARFIIPPLISAGTSAFRALELHQLELHPGDELHRLVGELGVLLQRQADVLGERHGAEQRAELVHHADPRRIASRSAPVGRAMSRPAISARPASGV